MFKFHKLMLASILNEIYIDRESIVRLGLGSLSDLPKLILPRPLKSYPISIFLARLPEVLILALSIFFSVTMLLSFFFRGLLRVSRGGRDINFQSNKSGCILLGFHEKVGSCYANALNDERATFASKKMMYQVSLKDTVKALIFSFSWFCFLLKKVFLAYLKNGFSLPYKDVNILFQSYVVFDLYLCSIFLFRSVRLNSNSKFFICNHYDRWAVICDFILPNVTLIQHGKVVPLELPYRLRNIRRIYIYDGVSKDIFQRDIVFSNRKCDFFYYSSQIRLSPIDDFGGCTVLYIAEPHLFLFEKEFISVFLALSMNVRLYVKPHPRFGSSHYKKIKGITLISEKDFYPAVDLAVFVSSTLGAEYKSQGIKVLQLNPDVEVNDSVDMVLEVLSAK